MADEYIKKSDIKKAMHSKYADDMRKYPEFVAWLKRAVDIVISEIPAAEVQPIVYAHKTINVGRRSYCSNCGKLAIMEDFCSKCGAKVKDSEPTRNLTDEETEIYESWIDHEAKDTGVNIMDGDINGY